MPLRHRNLILVPVFGILFLSAIPFSPAWQVISLLQNPASFSMGFYPFLVLAITILLTHSILLAGFIRHALRGIFPAVKDNPTHVERWVWFIYPASLLIILLTHFLIGWSLSPGVSRVSLTSWILGPITLLIAAFVYFLQIRISPRISEPANIKQPGMLESFFSLTWLYRILWRLFRTATRGFALTSNILEGDGGIVWALVLFALLFIIIQK